MNSHPDNDAELFATNATSLNTFIVAIDGPAGAGKSTVAKGVAERLGYVLVDTGAIYRAVGWIAKQQGVDMQDGNGLGRIVGKLDITFKMVEGNNTIYIDGENRSSEIRESDISLAASAVAAVPIVRAGLLQLQRDLAGRHNAVLEGRDIGTVVCPQARLKIFLDASAGERARRRWEELNSKPGGATVSQAQVLAEVIQRDKQDSEREEAPLKAADDAVVLDCTVLTAAQVIDQIVRRVEVLSEDTTSTNMG